MSPSYQPLQQQRGFMSQGFAGNFAGGSAGYGQSGTGLLNEGTLGGLPQLSPYEQWKREAMGGGDWFNKGSQYGNPLTDPYGSWEQNLDDD